MIFARDRRHRQGRPAVSWPCLGRIVVAAWTLLVTSAQADAPRLQDYRIARWTTAEGLPQNTINDIIALPNGELWLATFGGLARFDGARFQVIDIASDTGLASNRITALEPAGADAAWFVTQEGHLGRLEGGRVRTLLWPASQMPDVVSLVAAGGRFYSQTLSGGLLTSDGSAPWTPATRVPRPDVGRLNTLVTSPLVQERWVWTNDAVIRMIAEDGAATAFATKDVAIASGRGRELWVRLPQGIGHLANGRLERLDVRPAFQASINAILYVSDTELWVASHGVVSRITATPAGTWSRADLPLDLPPDLYVRALALDAEGSLWIGTNGRGLYRANRQPTRRFRGNGLDAIAALTSDGADGAWAAGVCSGIVHIDGTGASQPVARPGEPMQAGNSGCDHAFAAAPGGELWVRRQDHVYRIGHIEPRVRALPIAVPKDVGPILAAQDGTLWIVSRQGDVRRISTDRVLEHVTLPPPLVSAAIAPDGTLWVGGTGEVFHVRGHGQRVEHLGVRDGIPRGSIRDLLADPDGSVWIAAYGGGLGRLRNSRVTRLTADEGLPDNALSRILDDGRGRLWLATNRGIAVLERSEVDEVAAGTRRMLTPVVLGAERGVAEANFGLPAGFADRQGRLWFGTIEGVVRVDASRFPFNTVAPTIRVESVLADDRALPLAAVVPIPAGTARIRLNFTAAALLYPERMRFRTRIEGIDRDWVDVGAQRFVTFTPGGPGHHRFLLQARNEDGVWTATPTVVRLEVLPAWWQTSTARLSGIAGFVLAAFALYRQRVGTLERRHAARVRALEDRRRSEEQATALRSQLEHVSRLALAGELAASLAHEVNQPLTAIVANAEAGQHMLEAGAIQRDELGEMLHDIVVQGLRASEVIGGLREFLRAGPPDARPVDLSHLVHEMLPLVRREFEDNGVHVQLHLADDLPPLEGRRVQLGQVVVNLLMNACEALDRVDGIRLVVITTRAHEGRVELLVRDNGCGLLPEVADRIFEPFVSTKSQGHGHGAGDLADPSPTPIAADSPPRRHARAG